MASEKVAAPAMTAEREGVAERWVLEPCPFCGHPPKVDEYNPYGGDSRWTAVACYAPECGEVAFRAPTEAEAIAAWNRRALRQGGGWRPIESAPKDGTRVVLFWPEGSLYSSDHQEHGRWDDDCYAKKPQPYWTGERPHCRSAYRRSPPTHWQPLPPSPPSPAKEG